MILVDIIIIGLLIFGALIGFARGFTKQLVSFIGLLGIFILAFILKNPISTILYNKLPFFDFGGSLKGVSSLNILLYETISFVIALVVLGIIFKILLVVTSIFEKFLTMTIILGIPSKILGAVLGLVEYFIIVFVGLYIISLPIFKNDILNKSSLSGKILNSTPILSNICSDTVSVFNEINSLREEYKDTDDKNSFNQKVLDMMIEKKIISQDNVTSLIESGKLKGVK